MTDWKKIIFEYICPTLGVFISTALYSAPVKVSTIVNGYQWNHGNDNDAKVDTDRVFLTFFRMFANILVAC